MNHGRTLHGPMGHRPAFRFWGWTMLIVVLLCSAAASGQPRTRLIGSAFDPTTTSVALHPKRPRVAAKIVKAAGKSLPSKADPLQLVAIAARPSPATDPTAANITEQHARPAAVIVARSPTLPLGARAPPLL
jgi:hypothetical protein